MLTSADILNGVIKKTMGLKSFKLVKVTESKFSKDFLNSTFTFKGNSLIKTFDAHSEKLTPALLDKLVNELIAVQVDVVKL